MEKPCRTTLHHDDDDDDDDDDGGVPMLAYVAVCMELQHTHTHKGAVPYIVRLFIFKHVLLMIRH